MNIESPFAPRSILSNCPNKIIHILLVLGALLLMQCAPLSNSNPNQPAPTNTPAVTARPSRTPTRPRPTPSPTLPNPPTIFATNAVTGTVRTAVLDAARQMVLIPVKSAKNADVVISSQPGDNAQSLYEQVFAVADWFATRRAEIGSEDLLNLWQGKPTPDGINTLLMGNATQAALSELWGAPAANVKRVPENALVEQLWANHHALAIMPFDALVPKVRALPIDGIDLLDRAASLDGYPLVVRVYASGDATFVKGLAAALRPKLAATNRDPARMTKLIMTGVTAISRTSALKIDQRGDPALPARKVAEILSAADLTHTSNEVPFTDRCKPVLGTLQLCSKPAYIDTLKLAGIDLIGSTGNHLLDYGVQPFLDTLDLFDANDFKYFGGGRNIVEASRVLYIEDHGNTLAFLGMNSFGPKNVWATDERPGAQQYDAATLKRELSEARQKANLVFLDMQADETYEYQPNGNNRALFRDAIKNGADVVTGVQAHQPQAIEFTPDGARAIFYGLGNLFFDQMQSPNVRQGLVLRHTIHKGRLLQTQILPTLLQDFVQPRWTTLQERDYILGLVFEASGFK